MGQTVRQSMPSNAGYAFMQPYANGLYGQQPRAHPLKPPPYPYTIGVWEDRSEIALFISRLGAICKMAGAKMGHCEALKLPSVAEQICMARVAWLAVGC